MREKSSYDIMSEDLSAHPCVKTMRALFEVVSSYQVELDDLALFSDQGMARRTLLHRMLETTIQLQATIDLWEEQILGTYVLSIEIISWSHHIREALIYLNTYPKWLTLLMNDKPDEQAFLQTKESQILQAVDRVRFDLRVFHSWLQPWLNPIPPFFLLTP